MKENIKIVIELILLFIGYLGTMIAIVFGMMSGLN